MKKTLLGTGLAVALLLQPFQQTFATTDSTGELRKIDTIAHRGGAAYAPENTIAAFDNGLEMKADYIEIDVQRSKDGELVVIHDTSVDRTTDGTGKVGDLTLEQLKDLDAGSFKGEEFVGEKIPTFDEVLDRYHGKIGILIELKAPELYPGIEESVAAELKERNLDKPQNNKIILQSFNFESMKKMNKLLPEVPIGVLTYSHTHVTDEALKEFASYADYFNPYYGLVTEDLVEKLHGLGMEIQPWTVRSPETAQLLIDLKVDGIITDYPDYVDQRN